jgi:hypothetical protein
MAIIYDFFAVRHETWVASASESLPMVCPFAIGKAFGLAAATRRHTILSRDPYDAFSLEREAGSRVK